MKVNKLNEYDNKPVGELIDRLREVSSGDEPAIIVEDGDVVGTLLSPDLGKDALVGRMLRSLEDEPTQMDTLLSRFDEDIVNEHE